MGLEALSRGAEHAIFIEYDRAALKALRENTNSLGVEGRSTILAGDAKRLAASRTLQHASIGLLILDPPYRIENAEVREVIGGLEGHEALAPACCLVWEHSAEIAPDPGPSWTSLGSKTYGSTAVTIFERDVGGDR